MAKQGLHIGIILDGNRRFAKKRGMLPWKGHKYGADKVAELLEWCRELSIKELTLYSFSLENFRRPENEKKILFKLFRENIEKLEKDERIEKNGMKIRFIGRLEMFPPLLVKDMARLMEKTKKNNNYIVNFAMAYGGRAEIADAFRKIALEVKKGKISAEDIDEKIITKNLYLSSEPDLVIRPGGEKRVSNFLIWQSYYSEWHFTDKLWPEFTKSDFINAIADFRKRERRFGE